MSMRALPDEPRLDVRTSKSPFARAQLARAGHLVVVVPRDARPSVWRGVPEGAELARLLRQAPDPQAVPAVHTRVGAATPASVAAFDASGGAFERLTFARKLVAHLVATGARTATLVMPGFDGPVRDALAEATVAAALAAVAPMPSLKRTPPPAPRLRALHVYGLNDTLPLERLHAEAAGNGLARWLGALPPNELTIAGYRERIQALARANGWELTIYDEAELAKRKAGAFLAVAQGNATRDACIVRLRHRPAGARARARVALVGKGICFDTGGTNLKAARGMQHMHEDMLGSAVALGLLLALTRLRVPWGVDCWLAITENRLSAGAYKPHDVVTASNGTTIEVVHTDAEGRMVLADTLALATNERPGLVVDFATLTGACVNALTERYSGAFTNRTELEPAIVRAGRTSGERVWPFPTDADFDEALESPIADVRQCVIENEGDHILAARFLGRFIAHDAPWIHLDLAAARKKGGLAHVPTDITGFGVRYMLALLLDEQLPRPDGAARR
jgi:leucyl aminopeptidase